MSISGISGSSSYYDYSLQTQATYQADSEERAAQMATDMLAAMDTDANGLLSATEIGVDEDQLAEADSDGDGQLSEAELIGMLSSMGPPPMPPEEAGGAQGGQGGPPDAGEMFSQLDSDGDGAITQAEFLAGRPEDVSEEQATEMWSRINGEGAESLSEDEFVAAMEAMGPPPGGGSGPVGDVASTDDEDDEDDEAVVLDMNAILSEMLAAYGQSQYQQSMDSALAGSLFSSGISATA